MQLFQVVLVEGHPSNKPDGRALVDLAPVIDKEGL